MPRQSKSQTTHDRKVREIARSLEKHGYQVKADVGRRETPNPIGTKVPDIVAIKGSRRWIIEVETPATIKADREQLKTFARHAAQRKDTTFDIIVTRPRQSCSKK